MSRFLSGCLWIAFLGAGAIALMFIGVGLQERKSVNVSAEPTAAIVQCFVEGEHIAWYVEGEGTVNETVATRLFDGGTQVAVIGSSAEHGDVDLKDGIAGLAFRYRGITFTAKASSLKPC